MAHVNLGPSGWWLDMAVEVVRASDPTSQKRDMGTWQGWKMAGIRGEQNDPP